MNIQTSQSTIQTKKQNILKKYFVSQLQQCRSLFKTGQKEPLLPTSSHLLIGLVYLIILLLLVKFHEILFALNLNSTLLVAVMNLLTFQ